MALKRQEPKSGFLALIIISHDGDRGSGTSNNDDKDNGKDSNKGGSNDNNNRHSSMDRGSKVNKGSNIIRIRSKHTESSMAHTPHRQQVHSLLIIIGTTPPIKWAFSSIP